MAAKFEYWKSDNDGKWYWHLEASGNHETVAQGEGFETKAKCIHSINVVQKEARDATIAQRPSIKEKIARLLAESVKPK